jgi:hypothetical protein
MAEDYRRWVAPADAIEKFSILTTEVHQKYFLEVQKRIDAYKVKEKKYEAASQVLPRTAFVIQ